MSVLDTIRILRDLENRKDGIARYAKELCERFQNRRFPPISQFENLRIVASSTESIEEVKSFIYYQVGRRVPGWSKELGDELIEKIDDVVALLTDRTGQMRALRLFMGYLVRYARYYLRGGDR